MKPVMCNINCFVIFVFTVLCLSLKKKNTLAFEIDNIPFKQYFVFFSTHYFKYVGKLRQ